MHVWFLCVILIHRETRPTWEVDEVFGLDIARTVTLGWERAGHIGTQVCQVIAMDAGMRFNLNDSNVGVVAGPLEYVRADSEQERCMFDFCE
jgi:hypothetical protein